jgi:hypothetical protein
VEDDFRVQIEKAPGVGSWVLNLRFGINTENFEQEKSLPLGQEA